MSSSLSLAPVKARHALLVLGVSLLPLGSCSMEAQFSRLQPAIAYSPESLDFSGVVVDYSSTIEVEIINAGLATLDVSSIALLDTTVRQFTHNGVPTGIEPNDRLVVEVTCTPTTYSTYANTLSIVSNDPELPEIQIPMVCEGIYAPTPDIEVSPLTLDFGMVDIGANSTGLVYITNTGEGDLHIGSTSQEGSGAYSLVTDPQGVTVGADDDEFVMVVMYEPMSALGDNGRINILSDDPDEPAVQVILLGNGGGDFEYPVANIDAVLSSVPLEVIDLDGTGSYDPDDRLLTYLWSLSDRPDGSTTDISGPTGSMAELFLDLAGRYEVQLVVTNDLEVASSPAKHTITVIPDDNLHIEMFWDTPSSDIDLHLAHGTGDLFSDDECNYCNQAPEWGEDGVSSDDPSLDLDDLSGYGPENININEPGNGEYPIRVHYFRENGAGATTVTVRVYFNSGSDPLYEGSKMLTYNQVWYVGDALWPEGVIRETEGEDAEPTTARKRSCD